MAYQQRWDIHSWLAYGVDRGWCSPVVCSTHDGLPIDEEEEQAWEAGDDPCCPAIRIYVPEETSTNA